MSEAMRKIWGRFGFSLDVTPDEAEALISGTLDEKQSTITRIFAQGRAVISGESYIPGHSIWEYNHS